MRRSSALVNFHSSLDFLLKAMAESLALIDDDNWAANLEQVIRNAQDGDTIIVPNFSVQALAERAKDELYPDKLLLFVVPETANSEASN